MAKLCHRDQKNFVCPHGSVSDVAFKQKNVSFAHSLLYTYNLAKQIVMIDTRVGNLIVATIYLQLIQNRYMFRSFTVLQCSHQHCVQPVASDVEVVGYL